MFTKLNGSSWNGRIGYELRLWEKLPGFREGGLTCLGLKCFTLLFCFEMWCFGSKPVVSFRNGNANIKDGMLATSQVVEPEGAQLGG